MKKTSIKLLIALSIFTVLNAYNITPKNFNDTLKKHKIVVVDYWAPWCTPCSVMKPEYKKASAQLQGKVLWAKYNVDLGGAKKKGIQSIPTIIIYKDGKEVSRKEVNIMHSDAIVQWVKGFTN